MLILIIFNNVLYKSKTHLFIVLLYEISTQKIARNENEYI